MKSVNASQRQAFARNNNLQPAPNARAVVRMMATSGSENQNSSSKMKKLLPDFIGLSPLDPRLPKMLEDWQSEVKEVFEQKKKSGTYAEVTRTVTYYKNGEQVSRDEAMKSKCNSKMPVVPIMVDCPSCGTKVNIFENASPSTAASNCNTKCNDKPAAPMGPTPPPQDLSQTASEIGLKSV